MSTQDSHCGQGSNSSGGNNSAGPGSGGGGVGIGGTCTNSITNAGGSGPNSNSGGSNTTSDNKSLSGIQIVANLPKSQKLQQQPQIQLQQLQLQQQQQTSSTSSTTNLLPIQMMKTGSFSLNTVAAKITHVKTATIDGVGGGGIVSGGIRVSTGGTGGGGQTGISSGTAVSTIGGALIGAATGNQLQQQTTTATAFRAIGTGGQSTQLRVVMPPGTLMPSMLKHIEGAAAGGRTQITAIPARTVSNTSITVTRPVTQTTYLPRAGVTATNMSGQRLVTPIRTAQTTSSVAGLPGNFIRGTTLQRNTSSAPVPTTTTTWMANTGQQLQLIRAISHQPRTRLITQNMSGGGAGSVTLATATGAQQQQGGSNQSTIQAVSVSSQQAQQTYVATLATVLPPRQQTATLVYSSSVSNAQTPQQYNPSINTAQRFAVTSPLSNNPRQIRPIPLGKSFSTAKLGVGMNTTSISIRAPNLPQLTPSLTPGVTTTGGTIQSRNNTSVVGGTNINIPTSNLSTTRIIQLQQQPGSTTQQIISSSGRITNNLMLQPIIVNPGGKLGIRPQAAIATKVQPSLTITQLGKLPSSQQQQQQQQLQQNTATSIQCAPMSAGSPVIATSNANVVTSVSNLSASSPTQIAQIVSVSQNLAGGATGQLITTQNVSSAGTATVMPLAIASRGGNNVVTGTITPIKNANGITVGKVMQSQQQPTGGEIITSQSHQHISSHSGPQQQQPTSVFIHHASRPQSGSGCGSGASVTVSSSGNVGGTTTTVIPSSGTSFLAPGSTFYYESVPASSVTVSTGVLSLATTTVTSSTMSNNQLVTTSNLSTATGIVASHPFNTPSSGATFTVVPSNGRNIGQLQIPVSTTNSTQIQAVPVRFTTQLAPSPTATQLQQHTSAEQTITVHTAQAPQLIQATQSSVQHHQPHQHHQVIIPTQPHSQQSHMVIPLQTSIKVTSTATAGSSQHTAGTSGAGATVVSSFLRKRDNDISPMRAAKNLGPTLLSMSNTTSSGSNAASSSTTTGRAPAGAQHAVTDTHSHSGLASSISKKDHDVSRAVSPASSDGSTTVSANSSPGVDQQMNEEMGPVVINRMSNNESHFNPINDMYPNHHHHHHSHDGRQHHNHQSVPATSASSRNSTDQSHSHLNGAIDCPPRKKSRRSTNDSQQSTQSQASLSLPPPSANSISHGSNNYVNHNNSTGASVSSVSGNGIIVIPGSGTTADHQLNNAAFPTHINNNINHKVNNMSSASISAGGGATAANNKENTKPTEFVLRKPRTCTLLNGYKQNWKAANNHFQRHSDIKPREERRPTVMDLANQANVLGKINGWKIYHLRSQMEDLCENESSGYDKLATMLKQMEMHENNPDIERISDLLKGNMQRSKIIVEGVNEAQNQIMKIFDHKSHISDIIHRCASKRNFKKREKL